MLYIIIIIIILNTRTRRVYIELGISYAVLYILYLHHPLRLLLHIIISIIFSMISLHPIWYIEIQ